MSYLKKLSIQGIRSFGADDESRQQIKFYTPLTLLVGENGCGKTTVIEALKYITTGDMPPGAKGASFVHDPKIAGETEIKAQIRLLYSDITGATVQVVRSMQVFQKMKKTEFHSLEGFIKRNNQSISSKCADIEADTIAGFGVSKPVLNNVIFCHQDDSNWPLSDGKTLKGKFDDIFAATRYIKALENIKKIRQEHAANAKNFDTELKYLKVNKDKAVELKKQVDCTKERIEESKNRLSEIETQRIPNRNELESIENKMLQYQTLINEKTVLTNLYSEKHRDSKDLEKRLNQHGMLLSDSDDELKRRVAAKDDWVAELDSKLQQTRLSLEKAENKIVEIEKDREVNVVKKTKIERELQDFKSLDKEQSRLIKHVGQKYSISEKNPAAFLDLLRKAIADKKDELEKSTKIFKSNFCDVEASLNNKKSDHVRLTECIKMKNEQLSKTKKSLSEIKTKLVSLGTDANRVSLITSEIKKLQKKINELNTTDTNLFEKEIRKLQEQENALEVQVNKCCKDLTTISSQAAVKAKIDVLQKNLDAKRSSNQSLINKIESDVATILGSFCKETCKLELEKFLSKVLSEYNEAQIALNKVSVKLQSLENSKKSLLSEMQKKQSRKLSLENQLSNSDFENNAEEHVNELTQEIGKLQNKIGELKSSSFFYESYCSSMKEDNPKCPVCYRHFPNDDAVEEVIDRLQHMKAKIPDLLKLTEKKLRLKESRLVEGQSLIPVFNEITQLEKTELPECNEQIASIKQEIDNTRRKFEQSEEAFDSIDFNKKLADSVYPHVLELDRSLKECKEIEKKILLEKDKLPKNFVNKTLEEVNQEKELLDKKLKDTRIVISEKQNYILDHREKLSNLNSKFNALECEKNEINSSLQQENMLKEKKVNCELELSSLSEEINLANKELSPVNVSIEIFEKKLQNISEAHNKSVEESKDALMKMQNYDSNIAKNHSDLIQLQASQLDEHFKKITDTIQSNIDRKTELDEEVVGHRNTMDEIKNNIAQQATLAQNVEDNLRLRAMRMDLIKQKSKIKEIESNCNEKDYHSLSSKRSRLLSNNDDFDRECHRIQGSLKELEKSLTATNAEINSAQYKSAADDFKKMYIKSKTTQIVQVDLDKYYKALDKAVMNYHRLKMAEINKRIKELWRQTYKGNDIDTILISTEDGEYTGTRKTYNYRVQMVRGDALMEMRGRCSAGQKVLASIIIRLALAETFCFNCGVLALDEPTTNLDSSNIESLAIALKNVVRARCKQRGFQLIIITHDVRFVELIARDELVETYFKLFRNSDGKSRIEEHDIRDFIL